MGRKKDKAFTKIYKKDELTNRYMIEIAMQQYTDIFNKWDSASLVRREVDPDLAHYLDNCSQEIPFQYPIGLYFAVSQNIKDAAMEEASRQGIKSHYTFKLYLLKKELNQNSLRALICVLLGSFLLGLAILYPDNPQTLLPSIIDQAILIGGWIFIWEAFSSATFTNQKLYHRYRIYKRLQKAPVFFRAMDKIV